MFTYVLEERLVTGVRACVPTQRDAFSAVLLRPGVGRRCAHGAAVLAPPRTEASCPLASSALRRRGAYGVRTLVFPGVIVFSRPLFRLRGAMLCYAIHA